MMSSVPIRHQWPTSRVWRRAAGKWRSSAFGGGGGSGRVRERVVVRAPGRQRGSVVRGSVRVCERVVVSASGQAAKAARISET